MARILAELHMSSRDLNWFLNALEGSPAFQEEFQAEVDLLVARNAAHSPSEHYCDGPEDELEPDPENEERSAAPSAAGCGQRRRMGTRRRGRQGRTQRQTTIRGQTTARERNPAGGQKPQTRSRKPGARGRKSGGSPARSRLPAPAISRERPRAPARTTQSLRK